LKAQTDIILAGGGLAGLSLAWHLEKAFPGRFRMRIVEKETKDGNDRTWCFWERSPGPFEAAVAHQWQQLKVSGPGWERIMPIAPYTYKMIRSADLYRLIRDFLKDKPNVEVVYGDIQGWEDHREGVLLHTHKESLEGSYLFNSAIRPQVPASHPRHLLQHFKGYFIRTAEDFFQPEVPLFMDFRLEQEKDVRFVYILPFTRREALAEFTVFSPSTWPQEDYVAQLKHYLSEVQGIADYRILEEEFGVIPMTDYPHPLREGQHIMHTGTAGGMTRSSTGYTYLNTQRQCAAIVESFRQFGHPFGFNDVTHPRFRFYDSILLEVLSRNLYPGSEIFRQMFRKNDPVRVLDFLSEQSSFHHELKLFLSFPQIPFIRGFLTVVRHYMQFGRP
jgi:lycopene beta-cyclase